MHFLTKQELRQVKAVAQNKPRELTPIESALMDVSNLAKMPNKSLDAMKAVLKRLEEAPGGFRLVGKAQEAMISKEALSSLLEPYPMVEFKEDIDREGNTLNHFQELYLSGVSFTPVEVYAENLEVLYALLEKLPKGHEVFVGTPGTDYLVLNKFYKESKDPKYRGITLPQSLQNEVIDLFAYHGFHAFSNWGLLNDKSLWRRVRKEIPVSDFVLSRESLSPIHYLDPINCLKAVNEKTDSVFYFMF